MVVVALGFGACINARRLSAIRRKTVDSAFMVEEEIRTVVCPIGRLEMCLGHIGHPPVAGRNRYGLERAVKDKLGFVYGCKRFHLHIGEDSRLQIVFIVRRHADAHVESFSNRNFRRRAGRMKLPVFPANEGVERIPALFQPYTLRRDNIRLHLTRINSNRIAKLK